MYNSSNTLSLSSFQRSTEPEVFTFEPVAAPRVAPARQRRRVTRVMYPSNVRKYLPPAEKSPAKRWLLALCLVVFLQIYAEEASQEPAEAISEPRYAALPFQSAEEQVRHMTACPDERIPMPVIPIPAESGWLPGINATCWEEDLDTLSRQSTRNGYVVALLVPVYHTLGSEQ